jgi:hypothetical protein
MYHGIEIAAYGDILGHGDDVHGAGVDAKFTSFAVILVDGYAGHGAVLYY